MAEHQYRSTNSNGGYFFTHGLQDVADMYKHEQVVQLMHTSCVLFQFDFQGADESTGSNNTLFQASPTHVNFEVSTTSSQVVEERNRLESSHPHFFCSENLGFLNFKLKHSLAPQMILSNRSMCMVPHQGIIVPLFILLLKSLCGVWVRIKYVAYLSCI